jgi:transcriptional regulator with XRE-family HTH domain
MKAYTPNQIKKLRKRLGLRTEEFGEALNLSDPGRVVRGWESGMRNGKPSQPAGTAIAAIHYMVAIRAFLRARAEGKDGPETFTALEQALPQKLRA